MVELRNLLMTQVRVLWMTFGDPMVRTTGASMGWLSERRLELWCEEDAGTGGRVGGQNS